MTVNFERWGETLLGAAVAITAIAFFAFAAAQAGQTNAGGGYELNAEFQRVDGIAVGSDVRVSGVKVGVVRAVALNPDTYNARLTMAIDRGVIVPTDSSARIATDGLLGGAHVAIEPAGIDPLPPGGQIADTQGSVDLLTLFASFAQGGQSQNQETAK